jgi:hypothetical protein
MALMGVTEHTAGAQAESLLHRQTRRKSRRRPTCVPHQIRHGETGETVLAGIFTDTLDMGGGTMTSAGYFDVFLTSVGIVP